jgi:pyrimidine deaminase RibD-like protein
MDSDLLAEAIELSRRCPPSTTAYAVGAVILAAPTPGPAPGTAPGLPPGPAPGTAPGLPPGRPPGPASGRASSLRAGPVSGPASGGAAGSEPAGGAVRAVGWSRRTGPHDHAEEVALVALAAAGGDPAGGTLYSSMEPCSQRRSRRHTCTELILAAGIARVVFALREPPLFADCHGAELLAKAGVEVVEWPELADRVRRINAALLG